MERRLFIERSDFAEVPAAGFRRLVPGGEVRLRYGYVVRCDEVPWALFGISLAGFNAIFSLLLAALALRTAGHLRQGSAR
jgi:disulfide bond formation protein DsbB